MTDSQTTNLVHLPTATVLLDHRGIAWQKNDEGWISATAGAHPTSSTSLQEELEGFRVLHQPSAVLTIATDGGCQPNPGAGAWAWVSTAGEHDVGHSRSSTNNEMELTAIQRALRSHPETDLRILSDSKYAINCITQWGPNWMRKRITGKANQRLIEEIIADISDRESQGVRTDFTWVKGHSGHPLNESADELCGKEIARIKGQEARIANSAHCPG